MTGFSGKGNEFLVTIECGKLSEQPRTT